MLADCERIASRVPVVPMAYANMILARGPERFARALADAGAAGAIVPDLPLEEGGEVAAALRGRGAGADPAGRADDAAGAPGADLRRGGGLRLPRLRHPHHRRARQPPGGLGELIAATQADSPVPVAVGFGIGTPEQAAQVGAVADGVIVGTRLVRAVGEAAARRPRPPPVREFIAAARAAMPR